MVDTETAKAGITSGHHQPIRTLGAMQQAQTQRRMRKD